jgi:hypothetical protein
MVTKHFCETSAVIIFDAVASPISTVATNSIGDATAIASNEFKPASRNFSAIAGPTPGNSSKSTLSLHLIAMFQDP